MKQPPALGPGFRGNRLGPGAPGGRVPRLWRQQRSAFELMNQTLMDSLQNLVKRTNGVAGTGSGNGHDKGE